MGEYHHGMNYYRRKANPAQREHRLVPDQPSSDNASNGRRGGVVFFPELRANAARPSSCAGDSPAEALACIRDAAR